MQYRTSVRLGLLLLIFVGFFGMGATNLQYNVREATPALNWRILNDQNVLDARHENAYVEANGNFYLMGGRGNHKVEMYDPTDSTWSNRSFPPGSMQIHHFQPVTIGDTVYIASAYTDTYPDELTVDEVYKYVVTTDQWIIGSSIPAARRRGSGGAALYNGKIYIVGGSTGGHGGSAIRKDLFDEYDTATDTWTTLPDAPRVRDHVHVAVVGDKLYVAGGRNGSNGDTVEEVDIYNFITGQWSTLSSPAGDLPTPRAGAATVAAGDYVFVIGGESTQELAHNEVEALNTLTNSWTTMNPLNVGRHGTQAIFYNDNIYIASGSGNKGGGPELTSHEVLETMGETYLPVELAPGFEARVDGQSATLTWHTFSETNNAGFDVEHQIDDKFIPAGFVKGAGTSLSTQTYSFKVDGLSPGRHVFRLKQVDFDGRFEYSTEIAAFITLQGAYELGEVYPNPMNPQARFTLSVAREQRVNIGVIDMLGKQVSTVYDGILTANETRSYFVNGESLAGGKYMLVAKGEYFTSARSFTVIK